MGSFWFIESGLPVNERLAEANRRREGRIGQTLKYLLPGPVWRFLRRLFPPTPTEEVHRLLLFNAAASFNPGMMEDPEARRLHDELEKAARESLRRRDGDVA